MTLEQAIKKAIEGGFAPYNDVHVHPDGDIYLSMKSTDEFEYVGDVIFLDPLFWQALGKSLKLPICEYDCVKKPRYNQKYCPVGHEEAWLQSWKSFIDHLAEEKSAESFFKKLK